MSEENLNEIKNYLLEDGKEYRKNILLYLKWVLEDYEKRHESHSSVVQSAFDNIYPFYIEGIKTKNEWNRINKRGSNDFLIEHKTSKKDGYKSGWSICIKLNKDELESFLNLFQESDFPQKIIKWEYKMPTEEDFKNATEKYKESEWTVSKRKVVIYGKEYQLKALSSIAIGIANNLDSPANFYMFTTNELKNYIQKEFKDFKIVESKNSSNEEDDNEDEYNGEDDMTNDTKQPLNQILYGPPGTGKTYNTINKALEIILEQQQDDEIKGLLQKDSHTDEERKKLKDKFEEYKKDGQIEFVTFHQSYGYEEFVEGIKAKTNEETKKIEYEIESGIFKKLCEKAQEKSYIVDDEINLDVNVWKVSLGGSGHNHEVKIKCFKDNEIRIGWEDVEKINDDTFKQYGTKIQNTLENFFNEMQIGDFVISLGNQKEADAIGIIKGEYERDDYSHYPHKRKVKWLVKNQSFNIYELNDSKNLVQQTVYKLHRLKPIQILEMLNNELTIKEDNTDKNYILIIDEINRGNISKIFGELITLIEDSKRLGKSEQVEITLPYSGDKFGVPQNLYIIGTMNTADRSIAPIDTALRRRFVFEEMAPKSSLLKDIKVKDGDNETKIELDKLLEAINTRIEYLYDRDHTIGHAYLIDVKDLDDLKFAFKNKIIPLLAEYFYEDWENIDLVLNQNEMIEEEKSNSDYLKNINKINGKKIYKVSDSHWKVENFKKIYEDKALEKTNEESE